MWLILQVGEHPRSSTEMSILSSEILYQMWQDSIQWARDFVDEPAANRLYKAGLVTDPDPNGQKFVTRFFQAHMNVCHTLYAPYAVLLTRNHALKTRLAERR
jgi:hypothetical protein